MSYNVGAVITGGDFQGLGVLRTLAKRGIPIVLLDNDNCIGRYSKYKKRFFRAPSPLDAESYADFLINLAEKEELFGWVLFPNSDETVYVLSKYKERLQNCYRVPTPGWEVIEKLYVKANTYQLAEKHGIAIPTTLYPKDLSSLEDLDISFPAVVKPSIRPNFYNKKKTKAFRVESLEQLREVYREVCSIIDPGEVLIQDFIPGGPAGLYSFCPFFKDGKVLTSITARRARQHPMDFGHASTFAELVDLPELGTISAYLLKLVGYYGICEVEFMQDIRDGRFKLIEVNPRVWGWHTLGIAAGVDFPFLLYQDMIGEEMQIPRPVDHMKWVRLATDIPTVLMEILSGRMRLSDYVASMNGKKEFDVFSIRDPLPFIAELFMLPYLWAKRGF